MAAIYRELAWGKAVANLNTAHHESAANMIMQFARLFTGLRNPSRWQAAPATAQLEYYQKTAASYDACHVSEENEHTESLTYVGALVAQMQVSSLLDTGCGTGRGVRYIRRRFPELEVHGSDPSPDLLRIAIDRHEIPKEMLHCYGTLDLPFADRSFDVVTSFGVLHHVPNPTDVVRRMIQLSRRAVFISDCNYMGQGSMPARLLKLGLTRVGLWPMVKFVQQGFKGWNYSDGDGISYSYSVFNDLALLQEHFANVIVIPVGVGAKHAAVSPRLHASTVLVGAIQRVDSCDR